MKRAPIILLTLIAAACLTVAIFVGSGWMIVGGERDAPKPRFTAYGDGVAPPGNGVEPASDEVSGERQPETSDRPPQPDEPNDTLNRMGPTAGESDAPAARESGNDNKALDETGGEKAPVIGMGALTKESIREGIEAFTPIVKQCYETTLEDFPEASGKVTVKFRIIGEDDKGRVELSELAEDKTTLHDQTLHDCMLKNLGDLEFPVPKGGGTVDVTYPFKFSSDDTEDEE